MDDRGIRGSASFTPTAAEYTAGDVWGVKQEFAFTLTQSALTIPVNSIIRITSAELRINHTALVASEGAYTLHLYTSSPTTINDNAAYSLASADIGNYVGSIAVGTPVDLGSALFVRAGGLTHDVAIATSSLYGFLVNAGTCTPTAVARQIALVGTVV